MNKTPNMSHHMSRDITVLMVKAEQEMSKGVQWQWEWQNPQINMHLQTLFCI